jgi:tetratricopeptide (TPR) repeat protein
MVRAANDAIRRGQYEVAIQTARQALRRDEKYVPAMVVLARGYYHLKKYDLAAAILDIAAGIDEAVADIHYLRGFLALAQDTGPAALASFRRATEIDANHADAWVGLGALYVQARNYRDAVPALEKAAALAPASARAQLNLGSAYRGAGEVTKAEAAYRRSLEIRRGYAEAHFNLGILYLDAPQFPGLDTLGRLNAAIEQFTRYKERQSYRLAKDDPVDAYLEEARKGIERERKRLERDRKRAAEAAPAAEGNP